MFLPFCFTFLVCYLIFFDLLLYKFSIEFSGRHVTMPKSMTQVWRQSDCPGKNLMAVLQAPLIQEEHMDFTYPVIDTKKTGQKIQSLCRSRNISVKDIQKYLGISAFQSVYDWFHGKNLPSLDNMLALSRLLGVGMEELVVCQGEEMTQKEENNVYKHDGYSLHWRILYYTIAMITLLSEKMRQLLESYNKTNLPYTL